jgi:hypothetical protein
VFNEDHVVSQEEFLVLSLGDNFVAPRNPKQILLLEALSSYIRQLRIENHFTTLNLNPHLLPLSNNRYTNEYIKRTSNGL